MIAERLRSEANEFVPLFEEQRRRHLADPYPTLAERIKRLDALERAILAHRGDVATAIAADFGKSKDETEFSEIVLTLAELRLARRNLARWAKPRRVATPLVVAPATSERRFEPRGVVLVMGPFNYPFQLAIVPLVAALAAGNRAIVRLSEKVPNTRAVVATILAEAFAPTEVACVGGEIAAAQALLDLPFDHFFFTGSSAVGKIVMGAAARHLASVTLELGGKSPAIVHADADVDVAASRIAFGKYANAGQTCIAPDYALVHETVARAFVARAGDAIARMYGRDPQARKATPDFCRLIDDAAFARVTGLVEASLAAGARIAFGGSSDARERYVEPTILTNVTWDMPIMREEIFGPVLPVVTFASLDDALARIRARPKPLALYTFGATDAANERVLEQTTSGSALVNDTLLQWVNYNLPMGGVGASGQGGYHGFDGFKAFSHERAVMRQSKFTLAPLLAPPFGTVFRVALKAIERLP